MSAPPTIAGGPDVIGPSHHVFFAKHVWKFIVALA